MKLSRDALKYLLCARVARLATTDKNNSISLVPIVFACIGSKIYFVVDRKSKSGKLLKRLENISENGKATILVDNYSENWQELSYLVIHCTATIIGPEEKFREKLAVGKELKKKYIQYDSGGYFPKDLQKAVFVKMEPLRAVFWRNQRHSVA